MKQKIKAAVSISTFGEYCCHNLKTCPYCGEGISFDFCGLFRVKLKKKYIEDQWRYLRCKKCINTTKED